MSAKREETRLRRMKELMNDSAKATKLLWMLKAQEKVKPKYKAGQTPIEAARNIGPVSGSELRSVGIDTVEKLMKMGWEEAFIKLCEVHYGRLNLNMLTSLIGAVEDEDWRKTDPHLKVEAKQFIRSLRREFSSY